MRAYIHPNKLLLLVLLLVTISNGEDLKELRLLVCLPRSGYTYDPPPIYIGFEMGIEDVNARKGILDGYKLILTTKDTEVGIYQIIFVSICW